MFQGGLFTRDWLTDGIKETTAWAALDDATVAAARADLESLFGDLLKRRNPNEAETEAKISALRQALVGLSA